MLVPPRMAMKLPTASSELRAIGNLTLARTASIMEAMSATTRTWAGFMGPFFRLEIPAAVQRPNASLIWGLRSPATISVRRASVTAIR
jgi:hypothetical protein